MLWPLSKTRSSTTAVWPWLPLLVRLLRNKSWWQPNWQTDNIISYPIPWFRSISIHTISHTSLQLLIYTYCQSTIRHASPRIGQRQRCLGEPWLRIRLTQGLRYRHPLNTILSICLIDLLPQLSVVVSFYFVTYNRFTSVTGCVNRIIN